MNKELDELLCHGLREFCGVYQHATLARWRVVREPGLLEFKP